MRFTFYSTLVVAGLLAAQSVDAVAIAEPLAKD